MHFARRVFLALAVLTQLSSPARAETLAVRVAIPSGLGTSGTETSESRTPGFKYVTIENVRLENPSQERPQTYAREQFRILAGDHVYTPVVRPHLDAIDLHEAGLLAPSESTLVTVTFSLPSAETSVKFEFVPHWMSDDGHTVDFCCLYL